MATGSGIGDHNRHAIKGITYRFVQYEAASEDERLGLNLETLSYLA